jgi:hypothetical protein
MELNIILIYIMQHLKNKIKMKQINPIQSWINGQSVQATNLNAYAINVALGVSATFYYALLDENLGMVAQGNLTMTGEAYTQWTVDSYAWDWIAEQLNLTIVGDYVPPVPEEVEAPTNSI